jgi:PAS domain S-box-containing protein
MMLSQSPEQFADAMRWMHVPLGIMMISLVGFVRVYLRSGRAWLAWAVCVLRGLVLIVNFSVWPNINYSVVTGLRHVSLLGESVSVAVCVASRWTVLGQISAFLFIIFVADASISLWRRGGPVEKRRAALVGGSLTFAVLTSYCESMLVLNGVIDAAYLISVPYLVPLFVMAYELGSDVVRAARLSRELQESRNELRASEQRMNLATSAADLGLWEWDVGADRVWMSDRARSMFGANGANVIKFNRFLDLLHPDDREQVRVDVERALANGSEYEAEYRVKSPDGAVRWLAARGKVQLNVNRKPVLMRGVSIDISQRRQAEREAAQQRDELAHLSRVTMLGELSGSLAHELNQPLTAILSNAQAAQRFLERDTANTQEVREILKDIIAADNRAGETIHRLRLLFKNGEVQRQPIDVNAITQEVLRFLNSDLINHGVVATSEFAEPLPNVCADRVQIQQVLINLIVNASDAMAETEPPEKKLMLRTELLTGETIHVSICDSGCGIAPERLEAVFEPFVSTKAKGMGLGLAVCRTIVTAHGGKLWATNNPVRGTTFHLTLPAMSVAAFVPTKSA